MTVLNWLGLNAQRNRFFQLRLFVSDKLIMLRLFWLISVCQCRAVYSISIFLATEGKRKCGESQLQSTSAEVHIGGCTTKLSQSHHARRHHPRPGMEIDNSESKDRSIVFCTTTRTGGILRLLLQPFLHRQCSEF